MLPDKPVITVPSGGNISLLRTSGHRALSRCGASTQGRVRQLIGKKFLFLGGAHFGNLPALEHLVEHVWAVVLASRFGAEATLIVPGDVGKCSALGLTT